MLSRDVYVGNKSAVFPLQLLGFDVDVVNSVQFSNHTGYANGFAGDVLKGDQLRTVLEGLEKNNLLGEIGHVLTGYIGSESFLEAIVDVLKTVRKYAKVRYVCDPVLGDKGEFYVPTSLVQVYKEKLIPLTDVLTPNQFEVEQLTGINIQSMEDAKTACNLLHDMGPPLVVLTSMELPAEPTKISILASLRQPPTMPESSSLEEATAASQAAVVWCIDCPILPGHYTGTGDLCAAILLAHTALNPDNLQAALERVVNTMFAVISKTSESAGTTVKSCELKLIASKRLIEDPPARFQARRVE